MRPPAISRRALGLLFSSSSLSSLASDLGASSLPALASGKRRLYLCRHGETDWNMADRIQGSTDNPLNAVGRSQARALAESLRDVPFGLVASSNLQRARETADAVAEFHPAAARRADTGFAEMHFGTLEGPVLSEIGRRCTTRPSASSAGDVDVAWPEGEPPKTSPRAVAGLKDWLLGGPAANRCSRYVLIAAHGRFNKILISALRGDLTKSGEIEQGNTCVNVIDFAADGSCEIVALNLRDHLDALPSMPTATLASK